MRIKLELLILILFLTGCFPGFPEPDCGALQNIAVAGLITDENSNPVAGATILVQSEKKNACKGSQPIADLTLASDGEGRFSAIIPTIWVDDVIRIEVNATDFKTRLYSERTYTFFDQAISIVLEK
jgi:hypothetical protein